jgi:uncharacterized RDD family membrane protein YckC
MDTIKITTSQNVDLDYEAAGVGYRMLATLLDEVFKTVYIIIGFLILGLTAKNNPRLYDGNDNYTLYTILIIAALPYTLYYFLSETFMNGQSFGKKIVGTKVVKLDGTQPGVSSYMIRALLRVIDNGMVALIAVAVTEKSQRLGDLAAGTTVIKLGSKITLRDTILYKQVANYKIVFEQVAMLSDKDIAIVKEILDHSIANDKRENLTLLAQKVKTKIAVSTTLDNETFLKTVLLDYSHYQFER